MKRYMMRIYCTWLFGFIFFIHSFSQNSFFIDSAINSGSSRIAFSDEAIYFYNQAYLVKTNYSGTKIWSRDNIFSKLIEADGSLYGLFSDSLIKMDTAGN